MASQHLINRGRKMASINVFVGNLPLDMTETQLKQEFVPFGEILSASIMNDKYIGSKQQRGYGYVWMAVRAEGEAAIIGLNGKMLLNHTVNVLEALPLSHETGAAQIRNKARKRD